MQAQRKPPLCKGRWHAKRDGRVVTKEKQSLTAYGGAPFTQGSLFDLCKLTVDFYKLGFVSRLRGAPRYSSTHVVFGAVRCLSARHCGNAQIFRQILQKKKKTLCNCHKCIKLCLIFIDIRGNI